MSHMFRDAKSLTKPVHFKNVENVINMEQMFRDSSVSSVKLEKT